MTQDDRYDSGEPHGEDIEHVEGMEPGRVTLDTFNEWRIDFIPEEVTGQMGGTVVIMRRLPEGAAIEMLRDSWPVMNALLSALNVGITNSLARDWRRMGGFLIEDAGTDFVRRRTPDRGY